jgi:hypothetical protein
MLPPTFDAPLDVSLSDITDPRALAELGVEVWADVPGFPYEASNLGSLRNPKTGARVGTSVNARGYYALPDLLVHRAVLSAFDGPQPPTIDGCHGIGGRLDNRLTNLAWGTPADNARDTSAHGNVRTAQGAPVPPLDETFAEEVLQHVEAGDLTQAEAATLLSRSPSWVWVSLRRRAYPDNDVRDGTVSLEEAVALAEAGEEVWVTAVGPGNLEVSNLGRVRSADTKRLWSPGSDGKGYMKVLHRMLHRMVMLSFSDPPFEGALVRHDPDGQNRANCKVTNLKWGTYADNGNDTREQGRSLRGEKHGRAVLTDALVEEGLRRYVAEGLTQAQLSAFWGNIGQGNVSNIVRGKTWKHVARPPELVNAADKRVGGKNHLSSLTDERVSEARQRALRENWGAVRMAEYLGVKVATGSQILSVKTWAHLPLPDGYVEWRASRTVKAQETDAGAEDSLLNALVHRLDALCAEVAERPRKLEDSETLLTREELILVTREAGTAAVETEILPRVMLLAQAHVRVWGWFYPSDERGLAEAIRVTRTAGGADATLSSRSHAGTSFLHDRFHSFWDVAEGPAAAFEKPALLRNVLRYRIGLNNSKDYTYKLSTGEVVRTRETFDINLKNIRRGFVVQRQTASFFKPSVACSLYRKWITDTDAPTVWDPSCGFGARLLGFASAFPRGEYLGNEPATKTHRDVAALAEELCLAGELAGASVIRAGSEVETPFGPETLDLVFTSPPYFDLERYYDEPGQCWRDYPTERAWYENYLLPTVAAAFVGLKAGCRMVLNVDARRKPLALRAAEEVGFLLEQEDMLVLGADHFTRKREGGVERGEPVLVFRKQ